MKYKLILPILALLCISLVIPIASADNGSKAELGTFTILGWGIGRRLSGFACVSASGEYYAVWEDLNPGDIIYETLTGLCMHFDSGSVRATWYDGSWHRQTVNLNPSMWHHWSAGEITGSGNTWTITDPTYGTFTVAWSSDQHTSATLSGSINLPVDGVTIVLRIRGTAAFNPV